MKKFLPFLFLVLVLGLSGHMQAQPLPDFQNEEVVQRIAFGSCLYPRPNKVAIFNGILRQKPDVFIFLGDNIYGDTTDMELLAKKWNALGAVEGFKKLSETSTILATWDDHDYGVNDGGKSFPMRLESERIFLDFFKEPADSPRRKREGVYGSYIFGPDGKRCQILLLDTRSFRDELPHLKGKSEAGRLGWYEPTSDRSKSLLGEEQWKWLEEQLQVPADLRIIASSIQMLAHEKGMENWGNTPHELERLVGLLKKYKADHTFAISGDVHFAELSKREVEGYPFYDFTSSGMSHTSKRWAEFTNSFRVGNASSEQNAGLIEIDWDAKRVTLKAINSAGEALFSHNINLHDLVFPAGALAIPAHAAPQPNIVHILTDDLGWIDPAFAYKAEHGKDSVYETPNLDRLGANGTRFRQAYSPATTCAPSRAAYMAGQWPAHTGVYSVLGSRLARAYNAAHSRIDPFYSGRLPLDRPTIPQELKKAGYTTAHIQKCHFGGPGNGYPTPLDYGFDFSWDWKGQYNDPELWNPKDKKTANIDGVWRSMSPHRLANFPSSTNPEDPYCLDEEGRPFDAVSDLAVRWMDKSKDKPFFLNFCTAFVHSPFSTRDRKRLEHYCKKMGIPFPTDPGKINDGTPGQKNPYYASMLDSLDWQVGQLLQFLETTDDPRNPGHKLIDNTYVILSSDNGGLLGSPVKDGEGKGIKEAITDNRPLDGGKLTLEEGGIRIPFIVRGPGVPKGALNAKTPVGLVDMFPTFMAMAGAKPGEHLDLDGCNVLPVLKGESDKVVKTDGTTRDTLYFHFPSVQPTSSIIIKEGWKLRLYHGGSLDEKRPRVALYHLYNPDGSPVDESETKNLADEMPEKRDSMLADLQAWMKKFNAELPYKNAHKTGKPEPGSDRVPAVVSSKADGKTLVTEVESGDGKSRIVDAKLVYTTNGSKLLRAGKNTEEWYQTPAKIDGARISVDAPPGMTHGVIYLRDEHDFLVASEHLPPFSGSPDAISESAKGVDAIKDGFAWNPGLLSLIDAARAARTSAAAKNLDHSALDAEIAKAEKVAGQPAVEKTHAPAMRSLRQAIRALDVPEAKIAALNWFPKNANW